MKKDVNFDLKCRTQVTSPKTPCSPDKNNLLQPKSAGSGSKKSKKLMDRSPTKKSADWSKNSGSPAKEKFTKDITDLAGKRLPKIVSCDWSLTVVFVSPSKRSLSSWCQRTSPKQNESSCCCSRPTRTRSLTFSATSRTSSSCRRDTFTMCTVPRTQVSRPKTSLTITPKSSLIRTLSTGASETWHRGPRSPDPRWTSRRQLWQYRPRCRRRFFPSCL